MSKLVRMRDVQDAIDNLEWYSNGGKVYVRQTELVDAVDSIPAVDAVEVVRCADCKYYHTEWDGTQEHYEDDYWCQWVEPNEDDYCSLGQRREDGDGDG